MTFFVAALSMRLIAVRRALSSSSVPTAATAFFTRVRSSDLTALLRSRATTFCLLRLLWLLMFATKFLVLSARNNAPAGFAIIAALFVRFGCDDARKGVCSLDGPWQ